MGIKLYILVVTLGLLVVACEPKSRLDELQASRKAIQNALADNVKIKPIVEEHAYRSCKVDLKPEVQCINEKLERETYYIGELRRLRDELKQIEDEIREIQSEAYANSQKNSK